MKQFVLRPYEEAKDLPFIYEKFCEHGRKTLVHVLWGVSPCKSMEYVKMVLRDCAFDHKFKVIENPQTNETVGWIYSMGYNRVAKHETVTLEFVGDAEQTKYLLKQVFNQRFENPALQMLVFEVEGYKKELIKACEELGVSPIGMIEDHADYGNELDLYPLYTMAMTRELGKNKCSQ